MESSSRTLVCSVLFLDIVEYSRKPVAEQLQLKQLFNAVLAKALDQVAAADRIILDTGDGAAVTFMGDPEDALFAAMSVRDMVSTVPVRLGVNLGPVRLVKDLNDQVNIIGDGINVAQRVMSFSRPGQLLVSRSFYEVVSCLSRDYKALFRHEGQRTDKHVREHEVYAVVGGTPSARRVAQTESRLNAPLTFTGWFAAGGPFGVRRSALVAAPVVFLALLGSGMAARAVMDQQTAAQKIAAPPPRLTLVPRPETVAPAPEAASESGTAPPKKLAGRSEKSEAPSIAGRPGRLELAVAPWGEILIDGKSRGVSPPLRVVEIPAGSHTIEIRNSTFPSRVERIDVKAGEAKRIQHRFR
ncbi:MAG TPA: PEGA domain-containing protein [Burkholderiales bacterium]|nr:PEGA domain-containing protein [Burkholderiales bacterium]